MRTPIVPGEDYFLQAQLPGCSQKVTYLSDMGCDDSSLHFHDWPGDAQRWRFLRNGQDGFRLQHGQRALHQKDGKCERHFMGAARDCSSSAVSFGDDATTADQAWILTPVAGLVDTFTIEIRSPSRSNSYHWCVGVDMPKYLSLEEQCVGSRAFLSADHGVAQTWRAFKADDDLHIAQTYYDQQRPLVLAAAAARPIHPYFARAAAKIADTFRDPLDVTRLKYEDVVGARLAGMAKLLEYDTRDDARVEKDKCAAALTHEQPCPQHLMIVDCIFRAPVATAVVLTSALLSMVTRSVWMPLILVLPISGARCTDSLLATASRPHPYWAPSTRRRRSPPPSNRSNFPTARPARILSLSSAAT